MATIKITEFTDRKTVRDFLDMFESDIRSVCEKYGLNYERTKASYSSNVVSLSCDLRPTDAPYSASEHARSDAFAKTHGIEFGEHFIGSKYRIRFKGAIRLATVTGIRHSARKYPVRIVLDDGTVVVTTTASLKGAYDASGSETIESIKTYLAYTFDDDTMTDAQTTAWDAVDASIACLVSREKEPHFYELLDDIAENYWKRFSEDTQNSLAHTLRNFIEKSITSDEVVRRFEKVISHVYSF